MIDIITDLLPAILNDRLATEGFAIASTSAGVFQIALQKLLRKKLAGARDIWVDEIRDGLSDLQDVAQQDELLAIVDRYLRAAQEGAAKQNLRLLARVVSGQRRYGELRSSDFFYYADILSSLRHEEIILLGELKLQFDKALKANSANPPHDAQMASKTELSARGIFKNDREYLATAGALTRTGLIIQQAVYGGNLVQLTPLFYSARKPNFRKIVPRIILEKWPRASKEIVFSSPPQEMQRCRTVSA